MVVFMGVATALLMRTEARITAGSVVQGTASVIAAMRLAIVS
jgi:hypothetical protein